jgi:hypothetical protein
MMAPRTGLDTTHGQLAVSRGRCCWPRARSSAPAGAAWRSTWAAARAPIRWSCWLAAGRSWPSTLSQPGCVAPGPHPALGRRRDPGCVRVVRRGEPAARSPDPRRLQPAVLPSAGVSGPVGADPPGACSWRGLRRPAVGTHDTWADDPDLTFHARHQVEALLDGLDILRLEETERDGHAFSGPKHWHTFDILARKPISKHPSAGPYPGDRPPVR